MKRVEVVERATGKILFTLIPSIPDPKVYIMDDMTGLLKAVTITYIR